MRGACDRCHWRASAARERASEPPLLTRRCSVRAVLADLRSLSAGSYEEDLSTSLAAEDNRPRILLMGTRRSGKSSIQKVVFHKMVRADETDGTRRGCAVAAAIAD